MDLKSRTHRDYTVGWVCALPKEQTAATAMLDEIHVVIPKRPSDENTYTLGSIGSYNVVIACLPKGIYGTNAAASVAARMVTSFPSIVFGLMVGIGGGVPHEDKVRLGDVVASVPTDEYPAVVQWDMGKAEQGNVFKRTGELKNPPDFLVSAITELEARNKIHGSKMPEYLDSLKEKWPRLTSEYLKSDNLKDVLYKADYNLNNKNGMEDGGKCCDETQTVKREPRDMRVHYGLVVSGNQVIKDASFRESVNRSLGDKVLCIEMEAAGLMDHFPCIVIRGICDYADSHKNKEWQEYAAAVAAAFAKELLTCVNAAEVPQRRSTGDIMASNL
ncbi:nucleoside phosphorylase domain-containing protein [Camillea tinctor]|nr:nucleoside phosphorylase domain-containing protein [Camillea tinctor]